MSRCTRSAIARSPSGPWYTAYRPAMTASSTCAVQMLLVAFSRRMCCSRVCSASRSAGRPAASTDTPTSRPGRLRLYSSRVARNAGVRAAVAERHAEALRRADHDVGAHLPRRGEQHEREQVGGDRDQRALRVQAARPARGRRGRAAGARVLQQHAEHARRPGTSASGSPTTTSMPSGSARVRTTVDRLRVAVGVDEERVAAPSAFDPVAAAPSPRPPRWPRRAATRWRGPCR